MADVKLLDCTLRDGGYINDWRWGHGSPRRIIQSLTRAGTDIVEVGFLRNVDGYDPDVTVCNTIEELNRLLPPDVSAYKVVPVRADAHARFDALSRTYHYYVHFSKSPFLRAYSCRLFRMLDFAKMNEAAATLFDYTDFTSFSKVNTDTKTNNCRIMRACWTELSPGEWRFEIQADRFLRNMVRAIVGTLVEVGRGRLTVDGFRAVIEGKDRCGAGESMPGNALFLVDVEYPADIAEE